MRPPLNAKTQFLFAAGAVIAFLFAYIGGYTALRRTYSVIEQDPFQERSWVVTHVPQQETWQRGLYYAFIPAAQFDEAACGRVYREYPLYRSHGSYGCFGGY